MIVDTSAIIAILLREPEGGRLTDAVIRCDDVRMSAATYVECAVVVDRRSAPGTRTRFDQIMAALGVEIVPLTAQHALAAREAYRVFGRGSGHPAGLNLGDCFSYALAASTGEPLLFVGDDFSATDITLAVY